jgi:hypothetical protein
VKNVEYAKHQFQVFQAYANYWFAMAMTGACKNSCVMRKGVPLTDEENVADALAAMQRHIRHMSECAEIIGSAQEAE